MMIDIVFYCQKVYIFSIIVKHRYLTINYIRIFETIRKMKKKSLNIFILLSLDIKLLNIKLDIKLI